MKFDGSALGNPGDSGGGFVIKRSESGSVISKGSSHYGRGTNNEAEYRALLDGLNKAQEIGIQV